MAGSPIEQQKPVRLDRTVVYRSPWVNLYLDRVRFPNGRIIEQHHLLDFERSAVGAVVQNENGEVLMVQVPRYTTGLSEWEVPAGRMEAGEAVLQAARREVLEESGYDLAEAELVYSYYPIPGIGNVVFHIAHARAGALSAKFDTDEISAVRWFSPQSLRQMLANHEMTDGMTLVALLVCGVCAPL